MKKIRNILIVLIICLILVSVVLIIYYKRTPKNLRTDEVEGSYELPDLNDNLESLNIRNRYFVVQNIIKNYYKLLTYYNNKQEQTQNTKNILYSYFDEDFINYKKLTLDNIEDYLGKYNNLYVDINQVKYIESINLAVYFINGQVVEKETKISNNYNLMLVIDSQNSTFNLYTEDYIKERNWNNFSKDSFEILGYSKIENRIYNKYSYELIDDDTYCNTMFENFISRLKYNKEYSYSILDETYKEKKFQDLKAFEKYVENLQLDGIWLNQYKINKGEKNKEIICVDNKGRIWMFYEKTVMNYKVILDTYTVDLPEFIKSYNKSNEQEKTALNIKKIVDALNDEDYRYVYSKLADSFKEQNFKTLEAFEAYAKETFGIDNELELGRYEKTNNYETYSITLKNNKSSVTKTIIMDLQDGTNFVFSFNVE